MFLFLSRLREMVFTAIEDTRTTCALKTFYWCGTTGTAWLQLGATGCALFHFQFRRLPRR